MSTVWRGAGDKLPAALLQLITEGRTPRPGFAPLDRVVYCPAPSVLRLCLVFSCKVIIKNNNYQIFRVKSGNK